VKKLIASLALALITTFCQGQGTIAFGNSALTRITIRSLDGSVRGNATAADGYVFGVFYGAANSPASQLQLAPGLAHIGTIDGVLANAPSVFPLPGTEQGQIVSLQIRAWAGSFGEDWLAACRAGLFGGETGVAQVTLGPTAGPGTVIWQTATGTNPNRFTPLIIGYAGPPFCIPEPSMLSLGAVCGLLLLAGWRKRTRPM
jgi:hypothetical protein